MAAEIEGIYVPSFMMSLTKKDGTIESFLPNNPHAKEKIKRVVAADMSQTNLSVKAGCPVYQGYTGQSRSGNPAWLYPGMSFLSGWNGLPSDTSA